MSLREAWPHRWVQGEARGSCGDMTHRLLCLSGPWDELLVAGAPWAEVGPC